MAENIMQRRIKAFEKDFVLFTDPFKKVDALNNFCRENIDSMIYTDLCYQKSMLCADILKTIDYPKGQAANICNLGSYYWAKAKYNEAITYCEKALELSRIAGDKDYEVLTLITFSNIYISIGNYDKAFQNSFEGLRIIGDFRPSIFKWYVYANLGILYFDTKDYNSSLKYLNLALDIAQEVDLSYHTGRIYTAMGSVFIAQGNYNEALKYIDKALPLYRETGHDIGLSRALNDLGLIQRKLGNFEKAESYLKESYDIRVSVNHLQGMTTTSYELGELMLSAKKPAEALKWLDIALNLAQQTKTRAKEFQVHKAMANAYKQLGDSAKAYSHLEQFVAIQSDVAGQESAQKLKILETRMATEKAEKEAEIERLKNIELKQAHDIIADKNKEIVDSINYAWRIQSALLASDKLLKENLCNFFVLFKPKDIVSGDFYWATKKGDRFYIAACDSTGHGVPGAFMSILNASYMNEAINDKGMQSPGEVFNHVRQRLIENISQDGQKDGMDGILISLAPTGATYAAAYNSPVIVSNKQLVELPADKMPVGKGENEHPFNSGTIQAKKGDMVYLYTDGYADQFGGPNGKKFKYKPLEELLVAISELPVEEQKLALDNKFNEWKGNLEQVDDVLIMGIRI